MKNRKKASGRQLKFVDGKPQLIGEKQEEEKKTSFSIWNIFSKKKISNNNLDSEPKKNGRKNFKNIVFSAIFLLFIIVAPFYFERAGVYTPPITQAETTFLKVWHIDSFEGGSGNRATFLEKMATQFHKANPNIFLVVQNLSEEEVLTAVKNGDKADIISFSHHIANDIVEKLLPLRVKTYSKEELLFCGQKNDKTYAVPWNMAGYCLIGNSQVDERVLQTLSVESAYSFDKGQYNYIAGLKNNYGQVAMMENTTAKCDLTKCDKNIFDKTTYQAYTDFVANKGAVLLGTTRDVHRIENRVSLSSMQDVKFLPLGKFTDMVQFLGCMNGKNQLSAESFIEYVTSNENQKQLKNIGLFSPNKLYLYNESPLKEMEEKLNQKLESISLFMSEEEKQQLYSKAIKEMY